MQAPSFRSSAGAGCATSSFSSPLSVSLYVLSAGNFFGHERMCSMAIPFYALLMASLFCNGYEDTGRLYRFATSALSAMLMLNNYSLLLLRTHDWARAGQINKKVMEIFVRGSDEAAGRKIHTVGFHEVRLWFLRGSRSSVMRARCTAGAIGGTGRIARSMRPISGSGAATRRFSVRTRTVGGGEGR